jgi:hypothetical protein
MPKTGSKFALLSKPNWLSAKLAVHFDDVSPQALGEPRGCDFPLNKGRPYCIWSTRIDAGLGRRKTAPEISAEIKAAKVSGAMSELDWPVVVSWRTA